MGESIQLVKGSTTYKIFKFVQKKGAVTSPEIIEGLKNLNIKPNHIGSYFRELIKKELVIKSKEKVQSPTRKESKLNVYGVSKEAIRRKIHQYSQRTQSDKAFLVGIKKQMFDILTDSPLGFTLAEVVYKLRELEGREDYGNWDYVGNTLREMALTNLIARSSFKIPANQMIYGRKPGFVYGRDKKALFDKVVKLMPKEVRKAYLEIIQSNEIFPADILVKKFGIEDGLIRSWFINRLISTGWVKTYSYKQRRYYYNPKIPESYVAERVPKIHEEEVVKSILENSTLGNEFEKQAIFYFVMYLITKRGCQVRLNKDFPKKIPSWFNRDDIRNPEYVVLDKEGNPTGKTLVDVWRFDNEPFDYFVFTYDEVLESPAETYAISIKRDQNRKYLGIAGKRYMASMGLSINGG